MQLRAEPSAGATLVVKDTDQENARCMAAACRLAEAIADAVGGRIDEEAWDRLRAEHGSPGAET